MGLKRIAASALAAVFAITGLGSILVMQQQPRPVDAVELSGDDQPAIRREGDDGRALEVVDDDNVHGDGDATKGDDGTSGGNNTVHGDGDATKGDDGTSGGNNTVHGDGNATKGDDGTSGGNNTADNTDDNTDDNTGGGDDTD